MANSLLWLGDAADYRLRIASQKIGIYGATCEKVSKELLPLESKSEKFLDAIFFRIFGSTCSGMIVREAQ